MFVPIVCAWDCPVLATMRVSRSSCSKKHLDGNDNEHRNHCYDPGHCGITLVPEDRKTWVGQRDECSRKKMDKCGSNENAGAKMPRDEEEVMGDRKPREAAGYDGERACYHLVSPCDKSVGFVI